MDKFTHNSNPMMLEGFNNRSITKQVTEFNVSESFPSDVVAFSDPKMWNNIAKELAYKLSQEMLRSGYITVHETKDHLRDETVFRAEANAVLTSPRFVNLVENSFIVDEQSFTNEELVEAVKYTYPEKFI